jgi:hypothetical protein
MNSDAQFQESLSLEQIEDNAWGDPPADATRPVRTVYQLRRKPIGTMQVEDLRLLLLQQEGVTSITCGFVEIVSDKRFSGRWKTGHTNIDVEIQ